MGFVEFGSVGGAFVAFGSVVFGPVLLESVGFVGEPESKGGLVIGSDMRIGSRQSKVNKQGKKKLSKKASGTGKPEE